MRITMRVWALSMTVLCAVRTHAEPPLSTFDIRKFGQGDRISFTPDSSASRMEQFSSTIQAEAQKEEGLGLLIKPKASVSYDSSAFDDFSEKSDWYFDGEVGLIRPIQVSSNFLFLPMASAEWVRYDRYSDLDFDLFAAGLVVDHALREDILLELSAVNIWIFQPGFDDNFLTLTDCSGSLAKNWQLEGRGLLSEDASASLTAAATRRFADNDQAERWTFNVTPAWTKSLSALVNWSIEGEILYGMYDDPSDREYWQAGANTSVERQMWESKSCSGSVIAKVGYLNNDDTTVVDGVAVGDFEKWEIRPSLAVSAQW